MMGVINLAILVTSLLPVQDAQVQKILERYAAARPSEKSLGFYSLDWAMSLEEAKAQAKKESRPILLILNTNITAGTNFFSGHT